MISSTFGAPLDGTTRGGHQGVEAVALSFITPPNGAGGGGSCLPSIVVVAAGEPGTPVTCCAAAGPQDRTATTAIRKVPFRSPVLFARRAMACILARSGRTPLQKPAASPAAAPPSGRPGPYWACLGRPHPAASASSTRRFFARPFAVSLDATGLLSPAPCAVTRSGFRPCETRNSMTLWARFSDSIWFELTPCLSSLGPTGALSV